MIGQSTRIQRHLPGRGLRWSETGTRACGGGIWESCVCGGCLVRPKTSGADVAMLVAAESCLENSSADGNSSATPCRNTAFPSCVKAARGVYWPVVSSLVRGPPSNSYASMLSRRMQLSGGPQPDAPCVTVAGLDQVSTFDGSDKKLIASTFGLSNSELVRRRRKGSGRIPTLLEARSIR